MSILIGLGVFISAVMILDSNVPPFITLPCLVVVCSNHVIAETITPFQFCILTVGYYVVVLLFWGWMLVSKCPIIVAFLLSLLFAFLLNAAILL